MQTVTDEDESEVDDMAATSDPDRRRDEAQPAETITEPTAATLARRTKPTGDVPRAGDDRKRSSDQQDIGSFIRTQREAAQVSIRQLAERAGVSNPYLSQIERGLRKPSAEVLGQIAKALRLSAEVLYAQAGILELKQGSPVRDAILTAPDLTERQREVLVEIYESFRLNNATAADTVVDVP